MQTPQHFRLRAQEALVMARRAMDPDQKQAFEKIAASYLAMAENAERGRFGTLAPDAGEPSG